MKPKPKFMRSQLTHTELVFGTKCRPHYDTYSVNCAGLLDVPNISRQTEGHSFGDHLISESVSVTPSSVIEASVVLCSVSL
jgi:hypothetical protein